MLETVAVRNGSDTRELGYQVYLQKRPAVIPFDGWDAVGKGGAIKRIAGKLEDANLRATMDSLGEGGH
jgi:polyphosphate kinase 2 (PPK2 family)